MLISKVLVVKGCISQPKISKIIFLFWDKKITFKNIYHTLEDFSKFNWPFKSTVMPLRIKSKKPRLNLWLGEISRVTVVPVLNDRKYAGDVYNWVQFGDN